MGRDHSSRAEECIPTVADIGLTHKEIHEARKTRAIQKGVIGVSWKDLLTWSAIVMFGFSALLWLASTHVKVNAAKVRLITRKFTDQARGRFRL
ncbi:hypothetical protein U8326_00070 [Tsuneonella sp. CC-YZS046]|uniref:hypothetical protein n=1 Tax=Tsuneonella sp. CC-YZS046 TaxID=3042152 RepID=UPI002D78F15B|nr:hypothetical protein [Tsuneonella sp. CC-YZS046]WRO66599.1 hypothetical protein U8326_00070 [Tsuneonella sp. CC-YZS046]